jgi:hypothetical protein
MFGIKNPIFVLTDKCNSKKQIIIFDICLRKSKIFLSAKNRLSDICKHDSESDNKIHLLELVVMSQTMARIHCLEFVGMIWIVARISFLDELFMFRNGIPGTCKHDPHSDKTNLIELVNMIRILERIHCLELDSGEKRLSGFGGNIWIMARTNYLKFMGINWLAARRGYL